MFQRTTRIALLTALAALLVPLAAPAQGPGAALVRDLATSRIQTPGSPRNLVTVGDRIFFLADGGFNPQQVAQPQVAVTDGTAAGTALLGNPCDGAASGCQATPEILGGANGVLFYTTRLATSFGADLLWRSDGTRSGTYPLTGPSLFLDSPSESPGSYAFAGGRLFFRGCNAGNDVQCSLWASDGTVAGTRLLGGSGLDFGPIQLTPLGNRVYFFAGDLEGRTLWKSDGTTAGTQTVRVFSHRSLPPPLTAAAGRLFFVAGPSDDEDELWTSDGTAAGTRAVTSFEAPHPFDDRLFFKVAGGSVYFVADDVTHGSEIWRSDGTPAGTRQATDFGFAAPFPDPPRMEALGSRLVFFATDGIHPLQLWSTAGTPASTAPIAQVSPQPEVPLVAAGSRLLFVARDPTRGSQVWTTDGTASGTRTLLSPCTAGSCGSFFGGPVAFAGAAFFLQESDSGSSVLWGTDGTPAGTHPWSDATTRVPDLDLAALGGRVYFPAVDPAHGEELWSSDGRPGGSRLVTDLLGSNASSNPDDLTALGDRLFFTATVGLRTGLWQSAGTADSTQAIPADGQSLTAAAGLLFFTVRGPDGTIGLWRTNGAGDTAGTLGLTSGANVLFGQLTPFAGKLLFAVRQGGGVTLWQSDGTPAGTAALFTLPPEVTDLTYLTALGDELYFVATDPGFKRVVWRSDGTAAGTRRVSDGIGDSAPRFVRLGTGVCFLGFSPDQFALWRTDGTREGTSIVHSGQGFITVDISDPVVLGSTLYFFAPTDAGGRGLWRTDGTAAGTSLVLEITPQLAVAASQPPPPADPTVASGRLFFVADDGVHGRELWQSDGTAAGTSLVADLYPGFLGADPRGLVAAGGGLYFSANDGGHGRELWQSDGTPAGTRLVADVAPGGESSEPRQITAAGARLYWSADDGLHGRELWSLPLSGSAGCLAGDTRLCLAGGRFQVEIVWTDFSGNTGVGHAMPLTADTGYFWFFTPSNVETVVKVLDARALNQAFWVFYGALSSVEYTMTVTDTQTGLTRRYFNPPGNLASVGDTHGFGPLGEFDRRLAVAPAAPLPRVAARTDATPATTATVCTPGAQRLCLNGGRFAVEAAWKDFSGHTGTGTAVPLTGDTGYFWFFSPTNVEVMTKVLDGRGLNGKFWLFYGALSNVEYTLTVTDTQTGAVKIYKNPSGQFGSVGDTGAF